MRAIITVQRLLCWVFIFAVSNCLVQDLPASPNDSPKMIFELETDQGPGKPPKNRLANGVVSSFGQRDGQTYFALEPFFSGLTFTRSADNRDAQPLVRELVRQSLLIAFREHLGGRTRDMQLGESPTGDPITELGRIGVVVAEPLTSRRSPNRVSHIGVGIFQVTNPDGVLDRKFIFEKVYEVNGPRTAVIPSFARLMSEASATTFPELLKTIKVPAAEPRQPSYAELPAELLEGTFSFNELVQYRRVCQLHEFLDKNGPNFAAYQQLAIAYGHLGILTEHYWADMSVAFKARAVLYALRGTVASSDRPTLAEAEFSARFMGVQTPQQEYAQATMNLAYVQILCGRHDWATQTLRLLRKKIADKTWEQPFEDAYLDLVDAVCRYDLPALENMATEAPEAWRPVAAFHELMLIESVAQYEELNECYLRFQSIIDDSLRAHDTLTFYRLTKLRAALADGLPIGTAESLVAQSEQLSQLSKGVAEALQAYLSNKQGEVDLPARSQLIENLFELAQTEQVNSELTSAVLAKMLVERTFINAEIICDLRFYYLKESADSTVESYREICGKHPVFPLLQLRTSDKEQYPEYLLQLVLKAKRHPMPAFRHVAARHQSTSAIVAADPSEKLRLFAPAEAFGDETYHELLFYEQKKSNYNEPIYLSSLQIISPRSERALFSEVQELSLGETTDLTSIEQRAANFPAVLNYLAKSCLSSGRQKDAIRIRETLVELDPSPDNLFFLAKTYKEAKDDAAWAKTLHKFLELHEHHPFTVEPEIELSVWYMNQGELEKALEHAQHAALSNRTSARKQLLIVLSRLRKFTEADQVFEQIVINDPRESFRWVDWCVFHNVGRLDAAIKSTEDHVNSLDVPAPTLTLQQVFAFYLQIDQPENALEVLLFDRNYRKFSYLEQLIGIGLAHQLDDEVTRTILIERFQMLDFPNFWKDRKNMAAIIGLSRNVDSFLADQSPDHLSVDAIQKLTTETFHPTNALCVAAGFILLHEGHAAEAEQVLLHGSKTDGGYNYITTVARQLLRKNGREIGPFDDGLKDEVSQ